jgi:hypothetical protein
MRGRPILQGLLFGIVWLLLWWPIWAVTRDVPVAAESETQAAAAADVAQETVWLGLRFSALPRSFVVEQNGRELWRELAPAGHQHESQVPVIVDEFGIELHVLADLPEGEAALEVTLESSDRPRRARTLWVDGPVDEWVAFSWGDDE